MVCLACHAAVCGHKHFRRGVPCQDAAYARGEPRPYAIACDGRGSAERSHLGASAAVEALRAYLGASELLLIRLLDQEAETDGPELKNLLGDACYRAAAGAQLYCARMHGGSPADYEFTLLLFVAGTEQGYFLHVGDGALVTETLEGVRVLSAPENGEFANETRFVRYGHMPELRHDLLPMQGLSGVALFSDGTADGLLEAVTVRPAPAFAHMWSKLREEKFTEKELLEFLTRPDWEPRVQDDRCLALLAWTPDTAAKKELATAQPSSSEIKVCTKKAEANAKTSEAMLGDSLDPISPSKRSKLLQNWLLGLAILLLLLNLCILLFEKKMNSDTLYSRFLNRSSGKVQSIRNTRE